MKPQDNYCQLLMPQNYLYTIKHGIPQGGLAVIATFIFWSTARRVANAHRTSQYYRAKSEVLLHRSQSWRSFDIGLTQIPQSVLLSCQLIFKFHLIFGMTRIPSPF
jgi:hypothetical protein